MCYSTHRVIDAAIELAANPAFDVEKVGRIEVEIGRRQAEMAGHSRPSTPSEAKYSVEFAVAAGLVAGAAGFAQLEPAFIASAAVQQLIAVTSLTLSDEPSPDDPVFCQSDRVRVLLRDGQWLDSGEVRYARGHMKRPLGPSLHQDKFMDCARRGGYGKASLLYERLRGVREIENMCGWSADLP